MNIIIRTDASLQIGSGHVMRCLTLADELRKRGADVTFICRNHPGHLNGLLEAKGYPVVRLSGAAKEYKRQDGDVAHASWLGVSWQQDATETIAALGETQPDWLIVDHYALDRRWEETLLHLVGRIMVIDDLADRLHYCDLLLDQNLYTDMETRYCSLVPASCQKLLGPRYALLRPEFTCTRKKLRKRDGTVRRVLVFFGGVDLTNQTQKALLALTSITQQKYDVDVVVGTANPYKECIEDFCAEHDNFHFYYQVDNMAELMAAADLAIGASGATTWERCYLGLPSISVSIADNQYETAKAVANVGATIFLGSSRNVGLNDLVMTIKYLLENPLKIKEMERKSFLIMAGDVSKECNNLTDIVIGGSHV